MMLAMFFLKDAAPTEIYTLPLPDALPICPLWYPLHRQPVFAGRQAYRIEIADDLHARGVSLPVSVGITDAERDAARVEVVDRKSTRLNSSHLVISYAVFCLKKKNMLTTLKALWAGEDGFVGKRISVEGGIGVHPIRQAARRSGLAGPFSDRWRRQRGGAKTT